MADAPEPDLPDPATPDPATPDPATPDPATPDPATPEPEAPEAEARGGGVPGSALPASGAARQAAAPPRNRAATEARILAAAKTVLAGQGFRGFGINAVARAAGVDKQLIYRYFGDLDGLLDRLGADLGFWIGPAETALADARAGPGYADPALALLRAYLAGLRGNAAARAVLAWELVDPSPVMRRLGAARSRAVAAWFAAQRPRLGAPAPGVDAPALNALMLAGLHHLALREAAAGGFAGLDLADPATWERIDAALARVAALLDQTPPG